MAFVRRFWAALFLSGIIASGAAAQLCRACFDPRTPALEPGGRSRFVHICQWRSDQITPVPNGSTPVSTSTGPNAQGEYSSCSATATSAALWGQSEATTHQTNVSSSAAAIGTERWRVWDTCERCICHTIPMVFESVSFSVNATMQPHPQVAPSSYSTLMAASDWVATVSGTHVSTIVSVNQQPATGTTASLSVNGGIGPVSAGFSAGGINYAIMPAPFLQIVQGQDSRPAPGSGFELISGMSSITLQNAFSFTPSAAVPAGGKSTLEAKVRDYLAVLQVQYSCPTCGAHGTEEIKIED